MKPRVAYILSVLLHPVWMPLYTLFLVFHFHSFYRYVLPPQLQLGVYLIVVIDSIVLPLLITYLFYKRKLISSFGMEKREERTMPFFSNGICLLVAAYMLYHLQVPRIFYMLLAGGAVAVFLSAIINLKWKISIHMVGMGALTGTLLGLAFNTIANVSLAVTASILISGLLGTARLSLRQHKLAELYTGYLLGFCCLFFLLVN